MARTVRLSTPSSARPAVADPRPVDDGLAAALVLLPARLFLAVVWGRAAVEKAIDAGWWSGDELRSTLREDRANGLAFFEPVIERVNGSVVVVAIVAVVAQLGCALAFATGRHLRLALLAAVAMDVCVVLAGRSDPAVFFLLLELTLVVAVTGGVIGGRPRSTRWTTAFAVVSFGAAAALVPSVRTLRPPAMVDDPALVLIVVFALVGLCLTLQLVVGGDRSGDRHGSVVRWVHAADDPFDPSPKEAPVVVDDDVLPDAVAFALVEDTALGADGEPDLTWLEVVTAPGVALTGSGPADPGPATVAPHHDGGRATGAPAAHALASGATTPPSWPPPR